MKTLSLLVAALLLSGCSTIQDWMCEDPCNPPVLTAQDDGCGQPVYQGPHCFGDGFKNALEDLLERIFDCHPDPEPLGAAPCEPVYRNPCD